MYNLVPYSRSALFLSRLQPDPALETWPQQRGDGAGRGHRCGGDAAGPARGAGPGHRCGGDVAGPAHGAAAQTRGRRDVASARSHPAGRSLCVGLGPPPFWGQETRARTMPGRGCASPSLSLQTCCLGSKVPQGGMRLESGSRARLRSRAVGSAAPAVPGGGGSAKEELMAAPAARDPGAP